MEMRRTHLRGHTNILKRLLIHAGDFNLSRLSLSPDRRQRAARATQAACPTLASPSRPNPTASDWFGRILGAKWHDSRTSGLVMGGVLALLVVVQFVTIAPPRLDGRSPIAAVLYIAVLCAWSPVDPCGPSVCVLYAIDAKPEGVNRFVVLITSSASVLRRVGAVRESRYSSLSAATRPLLTRLARFEEQDKGCGSSCQGNGVSRSIRARQTR